MVIDGQLFQINLAFNFSQTMAWNVAVRAPIRHLLFQVRISVSVVNSLASLTPITPNHLDIDEFVYNNVKENGEAYCLVTMFPSMLAFLNRANPHSPFSLFPTTLRLESPFAAVTATADVAAIAHINAFSGYCKSFSAGISLTKKQQGDYNFFSAQQLLAYVKQSPTHRP